jgi:predicted RNA binding protein YcfA (HicA-like mRNA interferase family)
MRNFAKPLKKLLTNAGWTMLRQGKGDHEIWHNPGTGQRVTVVTFLKVSPFGERHIERCWPA